MRYLSSRLRIIVLIKRMVFLRTVKVKFIPAATTGVAEHLTQHYIDLLLHLSLSLSTCIQSMMQCMTLFFQFIVSPTFDLFETSLPSTNGREEECSNTGDGSSLPLRRRGGGGYLRYLPKARDSYLEKDLHYYYLIGRGLVKCLLEVGGYYVHIHHHHTLSSNPNILP